MQKKEYFIISNGINIPKIYKYIASVLVKNYYKKVQKKLQSLIAKNCSYNKKIAHARLM